MAEKSGRRNFHRSRLAPAICRSVPNKDNSFAIYRGEHLSSATMVPKSTLLNYFSVRSFPKRQHWQAQQQHKSTIAPTTAVCRPESRLLAYVQTLTGNEEAVSSAIGQKLFIKSNVAKQIKDLSGGEKSIGITEALFRKINVLILDEPTITSTAILEKKWRRNAARLSRDPAGSQRMTATLQLALRSLSYWTATDHAPISDPWLAQDIVATKTIFPTVCMGCSIHYARRKIKFWPDQWMLPIKLRIGFLAKYRWCRQQRPPPTIPWVHPFCLR